MVQGAWTNGLLRGWRYRIRDVHTARLLVSVEEARRLSAADGGKYAGTIRAVTEALAEGAVPHFARLESHQLVFDIVVHRDIPRLPRVSPPDNGPCVTLGQLQAGRFPREHETLGLESIHSIERAPDRTFSDAQLNRNRCPRAPLSAQRSYFGRVSCDARSPQDLPFGPS